MTVWIDVQMVSGATHRRELEVGGFVGMYQEYACASGCGQAQEVLICSCIMS